MTKRGVIVSGSLAYDRIFEYPGRFRDDILPEKLHLLNVSFTVNDVQESFGGTAGNIAYTLSLLGVEASIICSVGSDFGPYEKWLSGRHIRLAGISRLTKKRTAAAYIVTDRDDNQIAAFQPGAMFTHALRLQQLQPLERRAAFAILAPGNIQTMALLGRRFARLKLPYIFDPGQVIPVLPLLDLRFLLSHCTGFICNDYELNLVSKRSGLSAQTLRKKIPLTVTTLGSHGALLTVAGVGTKILPAKPTSTIDPTGAGDAFRSGLLAGIIRGVPVVTAARMGAVASVYTVERLGTQTHAFTVSSFMQRFRRNFSDTLAL